ncbi:MAG: type II secretion system F family protein [Candidatus Diapherotrites archaeon]|nr:type II secretion system F family protein [Candidatus Diapherotrites archaeon]
MIQALTFFFPEHKIRGFGTLIHNELNISIEKADSIAKIFAAIASVISAFFVFISAGDTAIIIATFILSFLGFYFFAMAFIGFFAEKKLIEKENSCAEALMHASLLPEGTPVEKIISYLGNGNYAIAKEFQKAEDEINKGASPNKALSRIYKRCKKANIAHIVQLLKLADVSGSIGPETFRESATGMLEEKALMRERAAMLTIQKVTVILSSMLLVPFILGILCSITSSFDLSYLEILGMDKPNQRKLVAASAMASITYVLELALISAVFLGMQDGNLKKSVFYLAFIAPIALLIFLNASALMA